MNFNNLIGNIVLKKTTKKIIGSTIKEEDVSEILREIRIALLDSDVNILVVKKFINDIKTKVVGHILDPGQKLSDFLLLTIKDELIQILGNNKADININKKVNKIMLVGLQGSGKTTTCAKIANQYKNKNGKKPLLVACDIYRPAAIDQLEQLAKEINVDFYKEEKNKPEKIVKNAIDKYVNDDLIIVDTAGRLQTNDELMEELIEIKKAISPDEILLVVDAMSGQDVMNVAVEFNNKLKLTGIIITKLDSDARAGAILSLVSMLNVPIKLIGNGEKIGSLDTFYPERIADRILGFGDVMSLAEKASEIMDENKIKHSMQRMLSGKMDLEDLMRQMEQLNKFGSLGGIMKMLPTNLLGNINEEKIDGIENSIKRWKVLLSSMTLKERRDPRVFKKQPNRKVRVIKGSGMKMDELNKLLKQWETGKNKMAEMGKQLMLGKNPFANGGFK